MKGSVFLILTAAICFLAILCKSKPKPTGGQNASAANNQRIIAKKDTVVMLAGINSKGIGRFRNIQLTHPLDEKLVNRGRTIYQLKCFACHKLTKEMLVGPGWSGVTDRRQPEWILNWITNTKVMLEKDLAAQAELVVCLIRMPDQDLTDEQARDVLEFMRSNDGKK
jgi:hypothetical protein